MSTHWTTLSPPSKKWLAPPYVAEIPRDHRTLTTDHPVPSSTKSSLIATYFPETDTYYVPACAKTHTWAGSPAYEVWVARYDNPTERDAFPEEFWAFRESALDELAGTGKCHWRSTDRWGGRWEEGCWGEEGPVWMEGEEGGRWDFSQVRVGR